MVGKQQELFSRPRCCIIQSSCFHPPISNNVWWCVLCGQCLGQVYFIFSVNQIVSNGVERVSCNTDKVKLPLHALWRSFWEARQLLPDVLLEGGPLSLTHPLNLGIRVSCQGEVVGATTPKRMGVDAVHQDVLCHRVVQNSCSCFQCFSQIFIGDVAMLALVIVVNQEEGFWVGTHVVKVEIATCKRTYWAVPIIAIRFVIHTHAFPPILLVVQFKCGAIGSSNETCGSIMREASESATAIFSWKTTHLCTWIGQFAWCCSTCLWLCICQPKGGNKMQSSSSLPLPAAFSCSWLVRCFNQELGDVELDG